LIKFVYEVIQEAQKAKTVEDKVAILKKNDSWALKDVLRGTYDEAVKWLLPEGQPPYTACEGHNAPSNLLRQNTNFKYFVDGGPGKPMAPVKRESIFIKVIESIHPEDAKLVIGMINKQPIEGLSADVINTAFPNLVKSPIS
jgi:hypothetical protein